MASHERITEVFELVLHVVADLEADLAYDFSV
jgi:hypothetical protein